MNAEIIRQGYGHAYVKYPTRYDKQFRQLERFAQKAEKGLWAESEHSQGTDAPNLESFTEGSTQSSQAVQPETNDSGKSEARTKKSPSSVQNQVSRDSSSETKDVTVYVTRTGKKYHRGNCSSLRKSKIPMNLEEAKKRYGPCKRCSPPR